MAVAYIYICPVHGETINVWVDEDFEEGPFCSHDSCNREVTPKIVDGQHVLRPLTEDEMRDETYWAFH